jgi:arylsulfatase
MKKIGPRIFIALLTAFGVAANAQTEKPPKPNIVFVLMDNLGYGEVGVYGGGVLRGAPTPRIDRLAAEGMRLTNFNVEAQCTPSRSAIMTGRFAIRSGTHSVPLPGTPDGLTQWEVTIAKLLSGAGYATALFGKWHLGSAQGRLPNDQGFDEWYGIPRTTVRSHVSFAAWSEGRWRAVHACHGRAQRTEEPRGGLV